MIRYLGHGYLRSVHGHSETGLFRIIATFEYIRDKNALWPLNLFVIDYVIIIFTWCATLFVDSPVLAEDTEPIV